MRTIRFSILIGILLLFVGLPLSSNSDTVDRLYERAAEKYYRLYNDAAFRHRADNWLKTIKQFQLIAKNYPAHHQAPKSLYNIGKLYRSLYQLNKKEIYLDRSNIHFRTLVSNYPESTLIDDAQFLLGENYEQFKNDRDLAAAEYRKVLELNPEGAIAEKARQRLEAMHVSQDRVVLEPDKAKASSPDDLTVARYGGLPESESVHRPPVLVSKVDYWSTADWSRMVINVKEEVRYKYQVLNADESHPQKRFYLDVLKSYIPPRFKRKIASNDGLISQARIAQFNRETVRVVLDMESLDKIKVFHFNLPNQYKIVIDIMGSDSRAAREGEKEDEVLSYDNGLDSAAPMDSVSLSKALGLKVKTIILDPGHGGKDPGAIAHHTQEKDIALKIAINLKRLLNKYHPDVKVLMTRNRDRFVELEARTAFANKNRGDLFISIHLNASVRKKLGGIETYYLNFTTDAEALELAAKENQTSLKSISDLQAILNDLMVNSKIKDSRDLASKVQFALIEETAKSQHKMTNLGVKKAPFTVLIGAQMPSILIEAGFLTNRVENGFLNQLHYRKTIARGIYNGLSGYLN